MTSGPDRVKSPVSYYFSFSGETGLFTAMKDGETISLNAIELALLDVTSSLDGWNDADNSRVYSNQFRSSADTVTLRTKETVLLSGPYKDNKESFKNFGAKYNTNLYGLAKINGESVVVKIALKGSGLSQWLNFTAENKLYTIYDSMLTIETGEKMKKGRVEFFVPKFSIAPIDADFSLEAKEVDNELLQPYLSSALAVKVAEEAVA